MKKNVQFCEDKKVLIVVPHQDDELSLVGPLIPKLKEMGFYIEILYTTNGDYEYKQEIRKKECEKVHKILGIDNYSYLGYADSGWNVDDENLYNSTKVVKAKNGRDKTCGVGEKAEFCFEEYGIHNLLTRENMLSDLKKFLVKFKPYAVFCVDYDNHCDHKITSLLTDEAMVFLRNQVQPIPLYFKGFCYLGKWYGRNDYFDKKPQPTFCEIASKPVMPVPYSWNEKVCISVDPKFYSPFYWKSSIYKCYKSYSSQNGTFNFFRCLNSDQIFWFRDLSNLSYDAIFSASSGDISYLNDGKVIDSNNIRLKIDKEPLVGWKPVMDDDVRKISIFLPRKITNLNCFLYIGQYDSTVNILVETNDNVFELGGNGPILKFNLNSTKGINEFSIKFINKQIIVNEIEIFDSCSQIEKCHEFISNLNSYNKDKRNFFSLFIGKFFFKSKLFFSKVFNI